MKKDRGFLGFGLTVFLVVTAGLLVSNALLYYLTDYSLGNSYYDALMMFNVARHTMMTFSFSVHLIVHMVVLALVFLASLLMSHRVSGPMYRFEKNAEAIADGDFTVVARLRNKDCMKKQADELNGAIDIIQKRLLGVRDETAAMKMQLAFLDKAAANGMPDEAARIIKTLRASCAMARKNLSFFKVE